MPYILHIKKEEKIIKIHNVNFKMFPFGLKYRNNVISFLVTHGAEQ